MERKVRKHINDTSCWCHPVEVFNVGGNYGKVYIHADELGLHTDPGKDVILEAVKMALEMEEESKE